MSAKNQLQPQRKHCGKESHGAQDASNKPRPSKLVHNRRSRSAEQFAAPPNSRAYQADLPQSERHADLGLRATIPYVIRSVPSNATATKHPRRACWLSAVEPTKYGQGQNRRV